jgi:glycine cleavage system H protein
VTGEVIEANSAMVDAPEGLGDDPYVAGWLLKVKVAGADGATMSAAEYRGKVEGA